MLGWQRARVPQAGPCFGGLQMRMVVAALLRAGSEGGRAGVRFAHFASGVRRRLGTHCLCCLACAAQQHSTAHSSPAPRGP